MNQTAPNSESAEFKDQNHPSPGSKTLKKILAKWFRLAMLAIVLIALAITIWNAWTQISNEGAGLAQLNWSYLLIALATYLVAMTLSCVYWRIALAAFQCHPSWKTTFLAFFASQLGKYVPGKAMVVLIRTDMIRRESKDWVGAAASVFVETLTWIFVGSVLACVLISLQFNDQMPLQLTAIGLALTAGIATSPPIFRWIASKLTKRPVEEFSGLNTKTMLSGWAIMSIAWCFNALSLYFVLSSFPDSSTNWNDYLIALACVSLATVAGFASLLPGGIGVRELVMLPLLGPRFGPAIAIFAAVLIRLIWISAELLGSGIIYGWSRYGSHDPNVDV